MGIIVYLLILIIPLTIGITVYYFISNEIKRRTTERVNELEQSIHNKEIRKKLELEAKKQEKIQNKFNVFLKIFNPVISVFFIALGIIGIILFYEYFFVKQNFDFTNRNHSFTIISPLIFIFGVIKFVELFKHK